MAPNAEGINVIFTAKPLIVLVGSNREAIGAPSFYALLPTMADETLSWALRTLNNIR
jgi:hypothetical protein